MCIICDFSKKLQILPSDPTKKALLVIEEVHRPSHLRGGGQILEMMPLERIKLIDFSIEVFKRIFLELI